MEFKTLQTRALELQTAYDAHTKLKYGKSWTPEQIAQGFIGDVGDLMKLILAKSGVRDIENADEKLSHELADCLWCIMVLSHAYGVDLEHEFLKTMDVLQTRIRAESRL